VGGGVVSQLRGLYPLTLVVCSDKNITAEKAPPLPHCRVVRMSAREKVLRGACVLFIFVNVFNIIVVFLRRREQQGRAGLASFHNQ